MEDGSILTVDSCTFTNNEAAFGGGLNIFDSSTMTMSNSTFSGNAASSFGGGIRCYGGTSITVSDTTFSSDSAVGDGGAAELVGCTGSFTDVTATSTTADNEGGAFWTDADLALDEVIVDGATAYAGGAVYLEYGFGDVASVSGGDYSNNQAAYGGVFYTYLTSSTSYLLVDTTTFSGNSASVAGSGVRYNDGSYGASYSLLSPTSFTCRGGSFCY
jgi:hypothetical protein